MRHFACLLVLLSSLAACGTPRPHAAQVSYESSLTEAIDSGQLTGGTLAEAYLMRGQHRLLNKNPDGAIADFGKAETEAPGTVDIYVWRASAYIEKKNAERAAADYQTLLDLLPEDRLWIICLRANAWKEAGRDVEALADYDSVLRDDPNFWLAHAGRGLLLAKSRRDEEALPDLTYTIERAPATIDFPNRLLSPPRFGSPLFVSYTVIVKPDGGVRDALRERAYIYFRRGEYERAIPEFEAYSKKSFRDPEPEIQIGLAQFALGQCIPGYQQMRTANWFSDDDLDEILEANRAFIEKTECADFVF